MRGTLTRELQRLKKLLGQRTNSQILNRLKDDPSLIMALSGLPPDTWQAGLLRSPSKRMLMLCCRQSGKSTVAAALALRTALLQPGSLTLLLSPTQRQSGELFRKVTAQYRKLGKPVPPARQTVLTLELQNGSRVIALPGDEETIRGFSGVSLVVLDEASRTKDELYTSVRPMLARSGGALCCLSTPFGKRGWFYSAWEDSQAWQRVFITAPDCSYISPEFLEEERLALGERWFRQEYHCSFEDSIEAFFEKAYILSALSGSVKPLFEE